MFFQPADEADLAAFLRALPAEIPVLPVGVGSNLIVRDGGIAGVVIRLGRAFVDISVNGCEITAGAAALDLNVANAARDAGIAGLEFLSGIPGTIGGALRMNGGAYGRELSDVVVSATALDRSGVSHALSREDLGLSYRHSDVPEDWIFTSAKLAVALKRKAEPDEAARLAFYESRARIVFDAEERGSHIRRRLEEPGSPPRR